MRGAAVHCVWAPLAAAGAFALLAGVATAAYADNAPVNGPGNGGSTLTIDLRGTVRARCGFKTPPPTSVSVVDLTTAGSLSEAFVLDCNTPFRLRISSQNGQLDLQNPPASAPAALGQSDPYQVEVEFSTDLGNVDETCASTALQSKKGGCGFFGEHSGQGVSSGKGVAIGAQGSLGVSWSAPTTTLVAGQYADTLTITVEARS